MLASIRRLVTARRTIVHVQVESLQLPGTDRRDLAARCEAASAASTTRPAARARAGGLTTAIGAAAAGGYPGTVMTTDKPVYLDHAATTPMHPAAIEAMAAVLATVGNASSLHGTGRAARRRMEESRETLAKLLGARPSEVVFTAGGTESDNLAVKGIYWARRDAEPRRRRIVTTAVEHHAVLDSVEWLAEHEGAEVTWLPTASDGSVAPAALREALQDHDDVALVSVMWANNEVGTIMPLAELASVAAEFDVPMHSDAVQAVGQIPVDFAASGLSAMSIAAHKFGGPTGVGALLLRRDTACVPLLHGGGQERDVRSGTPDVAGAVAMATAAELAIEGMETNRRPRAGAARPAGRRSAVQHRRRSSQRRDGCTSDFRATRISRSAAARVIRC